MIVFKKKSKISPELKKIFDKIINIINNEDIQNSRAPIQIREKIINGINCDIIPNNVGNFGYELSNPIPVNGIIGEEIYLSNLNTNDNRRIMFHRLGSTYNIDIYETVTLDGKTWDVFYLNMYHPRKSRIAPEGYNIINDNIFFTGINSYCENFPDNLYELIFEKTNKTLGIPLPLKEIKKTLENNLYGRPQQHIQKLKSLKIESLNI